MPYPAGWIRDRYPGSIPGGSNDLRMGLVMNQKEITDIAVWVQGHGPHSETFDASNFKRLPLAGEWVAMGDKKTEVERALKLGATLHIEVMPPDGPSAAT